MLTFQTKLNWRQGVSNLILNNLRFSTFHSRFVCNLLSASRTPYHPPWNTQISSVTLIPNSFCAAKQHAPNGTANVCYKVMHYGVFVWCIVGFLRWICSSSGSSLYMNLSHNEISIGHWNGQHLCVSLSFYQFVRPGASGHLLKKKTVTQFLSNILFTHFRLVFGTFGSMSPKFGSHDGPERRENWKWLMASDRYMIRQQLTCKETLQQTFTRHKYWHQGVSW